MSQKVRDYVSQPYSRTGNIIILNTSIDKFLGRSVDDKKERLTKRRLNTVLIQTSHRCAKELRLMFFF